MARRSALWAVLATAAILAGCGEEAAEAPVGDSPQLQAPSGAPAIAERRYAPEGEAAELTGALTMNETARLGGPPADEASVAMSSETILTLTGEQGQTVEALLLDTIDPGASVSGQSLRSLMDLPLDATPLLYQVTSEALAGEAVGLCGAQSATHLALWEDVASPEGRMKVLITAGGAPGAAGASLCQVLAYTRAQQ